MACGAGSFRNAVIYTLLLGCQIESEYCDGWVLEFLGLIVAMLFGWIKIKVLIASKLSCEMIVSLKTL